MKLGKHRGLVILGIVAVALIAFYLARRDSDPGAATPPRLNAQAEDLHATLVTATLDAPLHSGTNVLWCGTFQLAWNEAIQFSGEDLSFTEEVPLAVALNRKSFTKQDLDEESYVAVGGLATRATFARIQTEVRQKFGGSLRTELSPPANADLAALFYACLFKNLAFEKQFNRLSRPMQFGTNQVAAFGIEPGQDDARKLLRQVRVWNYRNTNEFIIELHTRMRADQLILAKLPAQATLADTVKEVNLRMMDVFQGDRPVHSLAVPKADFQITQTYRELLNKQVVTKKSPALNGAPVVLAEQLVRFRLDEKGALLKSESSLAMASAAPPASGLDLIFDGPFLVLMQRADRENPYFVLWVDNAELLVPAN